MGGGGGDATLKKSKSRPERVRNNKRPGLISHVLSAEAQAIEFLWQKVWLIL